MRYRIEFQRPAEKFIEDLRDAETSTRILAAIEALTTTPRPRGCLKIKGYANRWRIRVGRYRVVYSIFEAELRIEIVDVGDRKDVYRD